MRLKPTKLTILLLGIVLLFAGCAGKTSENNIAGKTYVYEKEGFGGDFSIQLNDDGTYSYYEGYLSSLYGRGNWTLESDTLILTDGNDSDENDETRVNYFKQDGDDLIFIEENSHNFMHVKVADGEKFSVVDELLLDKTGS